MPPNDLERTVAFERAIQERTSTRMVPFAHGTAYLNDGYRHRWDSNLLWVEGLAAAEDLAAEADRILGGAGLFHREIRVDDDAYGASIADGLRRVGYATERLAVMSLDRAAVGESAGSAEEISFEELRPALETVIRREPWGDPEDVVRAVADFRAELVRHAAARFFCARVDGEIASMCELYLDDGVAQIEDVNTLQEFRNHGLARAVVTAAAIQALGSGADLVFLHALDDDWPKGLYSKLGFAPIGNVWSFSRPSPPATRSPSV